MEFGYELVVDKEEEDAVEEVVHETRVDSTQKFICSFFTIHSQKAMEEASVFLFLLGKDFRKTDIYWICN